jgi:hypothetical protein
MGTQKPYIEEQTKQWPKVGRYQSGSQKPYIEEQTTQWSKVGIQNGYLEAVHRRTNSVMAKSKKIPKG